MPRILRTLHEVGHSGMVMPDHVPGHASDPDGHRGLAFAFGYIKGLIPAVHGEL